MKIDDVEYIDVKEAARRTGYAPTYITTLIRAGDLPAVKVGMAWVIQVNALARYQAQSQYRIPSSKRKPRKGER